MGKGLGWAEDYRAMDQKGADFAYGPPRGPGNIADQAPYTRLVYPPRIEKLPSSQDFNAQDFTMVLGAGAGTTITSAALSFTVPASQVGWLQNFSYYILTPTANTAISFAVRINQAPVSGFDNRRNPPGVANFIVGEYNDLRIRLPMACTVDIIATNLNASGPWTVGGVLGGWYHPQIEEARIFGSEY